MAAKSADATADVLPEITQQTEANSNKPIIMAGCIPNSLTVQTLPTRSSLTYEQFNAMIEQGYKQAQAGEGNSIREAFSKIRKDMVYEGDK